MCKISTQTYVCVLKSHLLAICLLFRGLGRIRCQGSLCVTAFADIPGTQRVCEGSIALCFADQALLSVLCALHQKWRVRPD